VTKILSLLELVSYKFANAHTDVISFIQGHLFSLSHLDPESVLSLSNTFKLIFQKGTAQTKLDFAQMLRTAFPTIASAEVLTILLNSLSIYVQGAGEVAATVEALIQGVGALPL
jgi:hypothetical protein